MLGRFCIDFSLTFTPFLSHDCYSNRKNGDKKCYCTHIKEESKTCNNQQFAGKIKSRKKSVKSVSIVKNKIPQKKQTHLLLLYSTETGGGLGVCRADFILHIFIPFAIAIQFLTFRSSSSSSSSVSIWTMSVFCTFLSFLKYAINYHRQYGEIPRT